MKYQFDYVKLGMRIFALVLLVLAIGAGFFFWQKTQGGEEKDDGEPKTYDVAVMRKDQSNGDSEEDLRSSLKAGDVALAREAGREWSDTEKRIFLILKMKLTEKQAAKLTEAETRKLSEKEAKEKGLLSDEMEKEMSKEEKEEMRKETVRARKFRIN
jgi:hypothetical protein